MPLRDLSAYLDDDALDIPVDGRTYRIESPDAETGLRLTAMATLGGKIADGDAEVSADELESLQLDDGQEQDFTRMVLGKTLDEMVADGVTWVKIQRVTRYAFLYFAMSPEAADQAASKGVLQGEGAAPNREQRRQASRDGASKTQKQGSTGGTTSPRRPAQQRKAGASGGATSSRNGT